MQTGQLQARDFDTGYILNEMPVDERIVHIDGLVRGIAYAHFFQNDKDNIGFECRLDHALTGNTDKRQAMLDFASNHADKPMGGVLFLYLRKKCEG